MSFVASWLSVGTKALALELLQQQEQPPLIARPLFQFVIIVVDRLQLTLQLYNTVCQYFDGERTAGGPGAHAKWARMRMEWTYRMYVGCYVLDISRLCQRGPIVAHTHTVACWSAIVMVVMVSALFLTASETRAESGVPRADDACAESLHILAVGLS